MEKIRENLKLIKDTAKHQVYVCECCGAKNTFYKVAFAKIHISILAKISYFCKENRIEEFNIKDLDSSARLTKTEYWNLNVLCRFWLLHRIKDENKHKIKGGHYGINIERISKFFRNEWTVAEYYIRNVAKKSHDLSENRVTMNQIKWVDEFLKDNNLPAYIDYINNLSK